MQILTQQRREEPRARGSSHLPARTPQTQASPSGAQRVENRNGLCDCKYREKETKETTQQKPACPHAWSCCVRPSPRAPTAEGCDARHGARTEAPDSGSALGLLCLVLKTAESPTCEEGDSAPPLTLPPCPWLLPSTPAGPPTPLPGPHLAAGSAPTDGPHALPARRWTLGKEGRACALRVGHLVRAL